MKMSKVESGIRVVLEFNKTFNQHDVPAMMQLLSDDCILESPPPVPEGAVYSGKTAIAQFWQNFFDDFPQAHMEIEEIFGFRIRCVMRWKCDWVDKNGEQAYLRGVDILQVKNELICEILSYVKGESFHLISFSL